MGYPVSSRCPSITLSQLERTSVEYGHGHQRHLDRGALEPADVAELIGLLTDQSISVLADVTPVPWLEASTPVREGQPGNRRFVRLASATGTSRLLVDGAVAAGRTHPTRHRGVSPSTPMPTTCRPPSFRPHCGTDGLGASFPDRHLLCRSGPVAMPPAAHLRRLGCTGLGSATHPGARSGAATPIDGVCQGRRGARDLSWPHAVLTAAPGHSQAWTDEKLPVVCWGQK